VNPRRASGILLHITSLPSRYGIGDLGREAYEFVDFLVSTGQSFWQVLPLHPTGYGNSPYQCFSLFAGNPLFISLDKLAGEGLLLPSDLENVPPFPTHRVDYGAVIEFKNSLLRKSLVNFNRRLFASSSQFRAFTEENASWLDDYALFMAVKEAHNGSVWNMWAEAIRQRQPQALKHWRQKLALEVQYYKYLQYQFFRQWGELKQYCNQRGIRIIGDMVLYPALDSADVWSHQELFYLDAQGKPNVVAGVPPDYFSETGQLWGNPLYRWDVLTKDGYAWWTERFRVMLKVVDIVRLDHFRGFEKYWEIPATETTAVKGQWVEGPGAALFEALKEALGALPVIAEDLGVITPEVVALREQLGFPGMKVLQFAFDPEDESSKPYNYPPNCVVYTGTHDNDTVIGWFRGGARSSTRSDPEARTERELALNYLGTDGKEINWDFIRLALASAAATAIVPLQDVLGLGSEARMNLPATSEGNWEWRFTFDMLTEEIKNRLRQMTKIYGRLYKDVKLKR